MYASFNFILNFMISDDDDDGEDDDGEDDDFAPALTRISYLWHISHLWHKNICRPPAARRLMDSAKKRAHLHAAIAQWRL